MKIINNVMANVKAQKIRKIVSGYQTHIEELMALRNEWRVIATSSTSDDYAKKLARRQIIIISNEITDLVAKRTKVLESSF